MATAPKWLQARWETLFSLLERATTEAEVKTISEAEIEAWRNRPEIKSESTLRNPMGLTQQQIKARLTGERREWALSHLKFSREWYITQNAASKGNLDDRLTHQQFINDPDGIVARATELLGSDQWPDIVVGLAVCTGRRLIEVVYAGKFEYKTAYSLTFSGAVKRQETTLPPFEIPTLCPAQQVIDAVAHLRELLPVDDQDIHDISRKYSPLAKEAANRHFSALVPVREGRGALYSHLFRTVYARIAVFWYAPPSVADTHYISSVCGHFEFGELETEELRQSYASNAHYSDYRIADVNGNIDGRQGVRLGMKGVELLEIYKPKPRKDKSAMTTDTQEETAAKQEGKNRPLTVDANTFKRASALKARLQHRIWSETVNALLDAYEQTGPAPTAGTLGLTDAISLVLSQDTSYQKFEQTTENAAAAKLLEDALADRDSFQSFLVDALTKEAKFRIGLDRRHADKDFSTMTLTQLSKTRHIGATHERIRRAIIAINAYNDAPARAATERWFINTTTVHRLVQGRYQNITEYLNSHREEVDALNSKYQLTERYNNKPYYVDSVVTVPDEPPTPSSGEQTAE